MRARVGACFVPPPLRSPTSLMLPSPTPIQNTQPAAAGRPRPPAAAAAASDDAPAAAASTTSTSAPTHLHTLDSADAAPGYGPRGVLLVGLSAPHAAVVEAWFAAMEPGFPVSHCTGPMLEESVERAVYGRDGGAGAASPSSSPSAAAFAVTPFTARPAEKLPRLALFAGMAPQEVVAIAENWTLFTDTPDPVLVTLLPGMLARPLGEVVLEATRAAASARATGGRPAGPNADRMDGASLKAAVRAKVEERRAGKGRGPVKVDLPGGGDGAVVVDGSGAGGSAPTVDDIKAAARRVAGRRAEPEGRAKGAGPSRGFGKK